MRSGRLGGEDAAWLQMEDATHPMVVNGLLELADVLPLARALEVLAPLTRVPRFCQVVDLPRFGIGVPTWRDVHELDLRRHVDHVELDGDDVELRRFLGTIVSRPLDAAEPLWHVTLVDRPGRGTVVVFRVHHAIADGFGLLDVLASLCDDVQSPPRVVPHAPRPRQSLWRWVSPRGPVARGVGALGRIVFLPFEPKTRLKGRLGANKRVAWSKPIPLVDVKRVAKRLGATVNDVLVAVAGGALSRYLERNGEDARGLELHAMVPVNLRHAEDKHALGNHFGLVVLGLPIGIGDPVARVDAVKQRMRRLRDTPEAAVTQGVLGAMGWLPRTVEGWFVRFFGTKTSLVLTNVPGSRHRVSLGGVPIERMMFWVPQSGRMGLGLSIFSYAGDVTLGVLADASVVPDPDALVRDIHAEFGALECGLAIEPPSTAGRRGAPAW